MWSKLSGVAEGWLKFPLRSGLVFWVGGIAAWLWKMIDWGAVSEELQGQHFNSLVKVEYRPLLRLFNSMSAEHAAVAGFVAASVIILAQVLVQRLTFPALRLLEGYYWPPPLARAIVDLWEKYHFGPRRERFQNLALKVYKSGQQSLTASERRDYVRLDREFMVLPDQDDRLPTRLGNLLRSYELLPQQKYGLDAFICWPRLWLLLDKEVREEVASARDDLNQFVQVFIWGLLFLVWAWWAWWALPVALLQLWAARQWLIESAGTYGELVAAAFDLNRTRLYRALRWPLPEHPLDETVHGSELSAYLWRANPGSVKRFVEADGGGRQAGGLRKR